MSSRTRATHCISVEYPTRMLRVDSDEISRALQNIEAWVESSNSTKLKRARHSLEDSLRLVRTIDRPSAKCHAYYRNQSSSACSQSFALTSIVKDFEYLQRRLSKKLHRTRLLRNIADRGCQILKAGLGGLKIASFLGAVVPSAEVEACIFALITAGEVAIHLLQKCGRSLSCEEENLTELVRSVECVQHFLREMIFD